MKVAFLFNSNSPELGSHYGLSILNKIVSSNVLQKTKRHMKVFIGDVMTYRRLDSLEQLRSVYKPYTWDKRKIDVLEATHNKATVYCWMFHNISLETAQQLHEALFPEPSYLGAIDLNYAYLPHFAFFGNGLIEYYRLYDGTCSVLCSMGSNEGKNLADEETFGNAGFNVKYEDKGARRTVFDTYYDSIDHHKRISQFEQIFYKNLGWNYDDIAELSLNLDELHPYLFNILYASCNTWKVAEVKEQLSQAYLSGRRFIEHIANFLFPPQKKKFLGRDGKLRDIKQDDYINRIAAYIQTTLDATKKPDDILSALGQKTHDLYDEFCRGVHKPFSDEDEFAAEKVRCQECLSNLGKWINEVIKIDPASIRRPYLAYGNEMKKIFTRKAKE